MPPKPNYKATTTRIHSSKGTFVETVVSGSPSPVGAIQASDELVKIILECGPGARAGFTWADGGLISRVTRGGLADNAGVKANMFLVTINDTAVTENRPSKEIEKKLNTARLSGKAYVLTFSTRGQAQEAALSTPTAVVAVANSSTPTALVDEASESAPSVAVDEAPSAQQQAQEEETQRKAADEAQRIAAIEEAQRIAAEEARRIAAEEATRLLLLRNGKVTIVYNTYSDAFTLQDGSLTAAIINDEYCLSDAMPGCVLHLSRISPVSSSYVPMYSVNRPNVLRRPSSQSCHSRRRSVRGLR